MLKCAYPGSEVSILAHNDEEEYHSWAFLPYQDIIESGHLPCLRGF